MTMSLYTTQIYALLSMLFALELTIGRFAHLYSSPFLILKLYERNSEQKGRLLPKTTIS